MQIARRLGKEDDVQFGAPRENEPLHCSDTSRLEKEVRYSDIPLSRSYGNDLMVGK